MTISILAISKMFEAEMPSLIGRQYLGKVFSILGEEKLFSSSILGQKYLRNALSGRAHASEEVNNYQTIPFE